MKVGRMVSSLVRTIQEIIIGILTTNGQLLLNPEKSLN